MAREVIETVEDHFNTVRTEWRALREKWFHGEQIDPVFEGVVRDFCAFDETMQNIHQKVGSFMRGVEQLASGMTALSDGVVDGLGHTTDHQIASDCCKLKEATSQIARGDAPHSAIAKLRRDMHFNILSPVQNHISNNRNLKVSLDVRRQRRIQLTSAKKQYDECVRRNVSKTDRRFLQAQSNFESAKLTFSDVDRHVFEWLYILEEYRGDILDSTLQTLKYLQYEFFASSAHAISSSLPARMEFRPMVEMTPEHLEAQVEMELRESEESGTTDGEAITDFSVRLIDKKVREEPKDNDAPAMPVDPLSLSSLLSQGFEEGPARRALRLHHNNTQAALDWLINGGGDGPDTSHGQDGSADAGDGVRMPTTVKRVHKLKAMRKAQQEKQGARARVEAEQSASSSSNGRDREKEDDRERDKESKSRKKRDSDAEASSASGGGSSGKAAASSSAAAPAADLLSLDQEEEAPTDFSRPVDLLPLPDPLAFDTSLCEKQPLPASLHAGTAVQRPVPGSDNADALVATLDAGSASSSAASGGAFASVPPELMATVNALAKQSQVTPEQLVLAAQQLAGGKPQDGAKPSGWDALAMSAQAVPHEGAMAMAALDPIATAMAGGTAQASSTQAAAPSGGYAGASMGAGLGVAGASSGAGGSGGNRTADAFADLAAM